MRIAELADVATRAELVATRDALDERAPADYRELAALLAHHWLTRPHSRVGLCGGQGAGKSTLGWLIEAACAHIGLRCCVLSLDDFYLPREDRLALAARVHPIFETRGPPGTHDVALLRRAMAHLLEPGAVELPVFDKGTDDRTGTRTATGPFDVVVVEGWCVGAKPIDPSELETPINALEQERDADGTWRRYVNEKLECDFAPLAEELDFLAFLQVPNLGAVRRWRLEQENERDPQQRMSADEIARFVEHYERISLAMLRDLPAKADAVVELDDAHRIHRLRLR
jgi:D-glycerate 3-kinase